jgi:hypothetical protein
MNEIRLLNADEIECRVGQTGIISGKNGAENKAWCSLLLYKDARCDQRIMDEVFGIFGWQKRYETINGGLFCTVSIYDSDKKQWIEKQDIGTESNTEAKKGEASDAFKRACFCIGVGRELYTAPKIFVTLNKGEWDEVQGKAKLKAKTIFTVTELGYDEKRNINRLVIVDRDGVIRYKLGEAQSQPMRKSDDEEDEFALNMKAYIEPALKQANDESGVKQVWDDYPAYQKVQAFISAVTNRLKEVKNNAA